MHVKFQQEKVDLKGDIILNFHPLLIEYNEGKSHVSSHELSSCDTRTAFLHHKLPSLVETWNAPVDFRLPWKRFLQIPRENRVLTRSVTGSGVCERRHQTEDINWHFLRGWNTKIWRFCCGSRRHCQSSLLSYPPSDVWLLRTSEKTC